MTARILVVDDSRDVLLLTRLVLERKGFDVRTALSGAEALEAVGANRRFAPTEYLPDLILLDLMMPDMDGYEVARRLRADARFQNTPILVLTGMTGRSDHERALQAGANDVRTKPITPKDLVAWLQSFLVPAIDRELQPT